MICSSWPSDNPLPEYILDMYTWRRRTHACTEQSASQLAEIHDAQDNTPTLVAFTVLASTLLRRRPEKEELLLEALPLDTADGDRTSASASESRLCEDSESRCRARLRTSDC